MFTSSSKQTVILAGCLIVYTVLLMTADPAAGVPVAPPSNSLRSYLHKRFETKPMTGKDVSEVIINNNT